MIRHALFLSLLGSLAVHSACAIDLVLPTANAALLEGGGPAFYQFIDRDFEGTKSTVWEGGQYGLVRNPVRTSRGLVYSRFHEGIDIRPVKRDSAGAPEDLVHSIAEGRVVYVNETPGSSNYGKYIVIEHHWDGCSYFSLYAHLRRPDVKAGDRVGKGQSIGLMGWTGDGLDMRRAHLHFEINFLLSDNFEKWHGGYFPKDPNRHGMFNGLNLLGMDAARFLVENLRNPQLTIPQFLAKEKPSYRVAVPGIASSFIRRYPWLAGEAASTSPTAWEITFNDLGVPLKAVPYDHAVEKPVATWAAAGEPSLEYRTRGMINGSHTAPSLTMRGQRALHLLWF